MVLDNWNWLSEKGDRDEFLARVSSLYYDKKKTQQEISDIVGVTRSAVSRLLAEARDKGIVEITVHYPYRTILELEEALEKKFGLKDVRVLKRDNKPLDQMKQGLGVLAAEYFASVVKPTSIIGVSWGTNLFQTIKAIKPTSLPRAEVVQLVGGTGAEIGSNIGPLLAPTLAGKLSCTSRFLNAPLITRNAELCEAFLEEPAVKRTIDRAKQADIAMVGIGAINLEIYNPYLLGYITAEEVNDMIRAGAVGDVCLTHFTVDGEITCKDINNRLVGIRIDDLKKIPIVMGVAGDLQKAKSIYGAIRAGLVNVLITDETAAKRVLELAEERAS